MIATCHYNDFRPLSTCTELKHRHHETISAVLPALNEEQTIGPIVRAIREFMESTAFIDEIIVMDGGSIDATIYNAQQAGARVVHVQDIQPEVTAQGKGVAMWKAQFVASGSILVFIDADLVNFDERYIVGPAGALLHNRTLELVKAFYRRPFSNGAIVLDDNGGRVTELFLRPLLNLFLPELSELIQPLAGEYAVRRESLASKTFVSGYGVETALLLDYYFTHGIEAIGQVDLEIRTHRNRSLPELSRMAFEIGAVFFDMLEERNSCTIRQPNNTIITTWESGAITRQQFEGVRLPPKNTLYGAVPDVSRSDS
jgi:glucosyl-3-phosphoglycerate synthase